MTRQTNARIAGFTFLFSIAVGLTSLFLFGRATSGDGIAAKLAGIAQHQFDVRLVVLLNLLACVSALVLGVTLYAITREQDRDLAMLGMICRVVEGVNGATGMPRILALLWVATATGTAAPTAEAAHTLGAYLLRGGGGGISAIFFALGSTFFSWLLLRGRMIPTPLAWLGVAASVLLVVGLPLEFVGFISGGGYFGVLWMPMLIFELVFAGWLIVKGVGPKTEA